MFAEFFSKLKRSHHLCSKLRLCKPAIGGIVKTYGGALCNHFPRGLLIGDAGSFVDPMTGEGITPAMESALIAASSVEDALETGTTNLSTYETRFRGYFDPSMAFLDLCAATLRNTHLRESWLQALTRGCEMAQQDSEYAKTVGACFGGLDIDPPVILSQIWGVVISELITTAFRPARILASIREMIGWQTAWWTSFVSDPLWHASWSIDVQRKWLHALSIMMAAAGDPRVRGLI
jgi:hypothetical protein